MALYYLDHAAATPLDKRVFVAMKPYFLDEFYNPSAAYKAGRDTKIALESARHQLAMVIGAKSSEIILTAGATESINLAVHGVMRHYGGSVVTARIEHQAVLSAASHYDVRFAKSDFRGTVDIESLDRRITDDTALVSIGYANNEIGTIQSLKNISELIRHIREKRLKKGITLPLFLHTDASQAAGMLDISISRLGVDMMTLNAGKCYGPKQVGLLWVHSGISLAPLIDGGGQERGLRSGTENVAGVVGFATALTIAHSERKSETFRLKKMRDELEQRLIGEFPDMIINGHTKKRLPHHLHISLPGLDGERAVFALDEQGVMVATGSACAANKGTRSHVLTAIGMEDDHADGSLRMTFGRSNNSEDIDTIGSIFIKILRREREL